MARRNTANQAPMQVTVSAVDTTNTERKKKEEICFFATRILHII